MSCRVSKTKTKKGQLAFSESHQQLGNSAVMILFP